MSDPIAKTTLILDARAPFDFEHSAYSHGWAVLAPNHWDPDNKCLLRVECLPSGGVVMLTISGAGNVWEPRLTVEVEHSVPLSGQDKAAITRSAARMFRTGENLDDFYALCKAHGGRWANLPPGIGRLLRSPTLFEDVVKTICTTNIGWGGTKRMVGGLVTSLGEPLSVDVPMHAFPSVDAIAAAPPNTFSEKVRMGYRGPYIHLLARNIVDNGFDLERLLTLQLTTPELKQELLAIKGVGEYAAATLLMLIGRYDEIPVDSVFREFMSKQYFHGRKPDDREAMAIYDDWGPWKGLAYWFDLWQGPTESV